MRNPYRKLSLQASLPLLAGLCIISNLSAQSTVVSFGGSGMVTTNQNIGGNGGLLIPATSISPASGYSGQTFYGGLTNINASPDTWAITNDVAGRGGASMPALDWISAVTNATTDGAGTKFHHGVVFFQQSDFLAHDSLSGGVGLESLSVAVHRSSGNPSRFGFVIETSGVGGGYFLSDPVTYNQFTGTGFNTNFSNGHWLNIADASAATWLSFDPETSYSTIEAAATPDLSKVTGVGIWFENERASASAAGLGFHITGLEVTAVPEPSAYALLAGALTLGMVMVRRRRA